MKKVFVNGTFDVLHPAHIMLLNYAKSEGDYLHVAIDADARVKEKKGESRPIFNQEERKFFLMNLKAVDNVSLFSTDEELENTIRDYAPDIMIVGSDWKGKPVIGSQFAKELKFYDRIEKYSTTATLQTIIDRR